MGKQLILNHKQIEKKITRLSLQVYEQFFDATDVILCGLNERGSFLGELISNELVSKKYLGVKQLHLDIAKVEEFEKSTTWEQLDKNTPLILADDVLNTGYTMMQASHIFFSRGFKNIRILVLADRNHRNFPIQADMVGISLSTTLQEHLSFEIENGQMYLYLS